MERFERNDLDKNARARRKTLTGKEYREGNPGVDTYDDGLDEDGNLVRPGSTATESGGSYMEDTGPLTDGVKRPKEELDEDRDDRIIFSPEEVEDGEEDDAAKWLRENDPNFK